MQVEVKTRGFTLLFDEPAKQGGGDQGPTPVEGLLAAMSACETMSAWLLGEKMNLDVGDIEVEVEGDMDTAGLKGREGVRAGLQEVRVKVKINAPPEQRDELAALLKTRCPVGDTVEHGTQVFFSVVSE